MAASATRMKQTHSTTAHAVSLPFVEANNNAPFTLPPGFEMAPNGLRLQRQGGAGPLLISQPFEILAYARTERKEEWSLVLRFLDLDGAPRMHILPRAQLTSDGAELRRVLADLGFWVNVASGARDKLMQALNDSQVEARALLASSTGWTKESFVLPEQTIAPPSAEPVYLRSRLPNAHYGARGTLEGWRSEIARHGGGNPLLAFALCLGFAPPLMRPLSLEGGIFHLRGQSSSGKTTLAKAAGSIWGGGGPLGFAQTWRGTSNAIEAMFAAHCDTLIVLDELKLVDPHDIGQIIYAATSGMAKNRMNANAELRPRLTWRTMALSTGELSLADHVREVGQVFAGQELRFLDILADAGKDQGAWAELRGAASPAAFANALNAATETHYGHAGPAFVRALIEGGEAAMVQAGSVRAEFLKRACRAADAAQVRRGADRFAVVAAAGELATRFGLTDWPPDTASTACLAVFEGWARDFGRSGSREEREIVVRMASAIEQHGASHFAPRRTSGSAERERTQSIEQWGWQEDREGTGKVFLVTGSGWRKIFAGLDVSLAARTLAKHDVLIRPNEKGRLQRKIDVAGEKHNVYVVKASVTELAGEA